MTTMFFFAFTRYRSFAALLRRRSLFVGRARRDSRAEEGDDGGVAFDLRLLKGGSVAPAAKRLVLINHHALQSSHVLALELAPKLRRCCLHRLGLPTPRALSLALA